MVEHSKTGIEKIIRESAIDKEKKTPGLKFNHGLVPVGFRTTRSRLESGIQLSESGIPLTIRIPNPESKFHRQQVQYFEVAESIFQDRLGFPYASRI